MRSPSVNCNKLTLGVGNGNAFAQSMDDILLDRPVPTSETTDMDRLDSRVTVAQVVSATPPLFAAGDEDGVIRIWTIK